VESLTTHDGRKDNTVELIKPLQSKGGNDGATLKVFDLIRGFGKGFSEKPPLKLKKLASRPSKDLEKRKWRGGTEKPLLPALRNRPSLG